MIAGVEIEIHDIREIPFYDEDLEAEGDPASVVAFKSFIQDADSVIFASTEYNWGISGVLKSAIDWASRDRSGGSLMGTTGDYHRGWRPGRNRPRANAVA